MKYYDPELKAKVVKEVEETGSLLVVARKYDIPSQEGVTCCRIDRKVVEGEAEPELIRESEPISKSA